MVAFVLIHVFEVIISGLWNNMRSMITGRYRVAAALPSPALTPAKSAQTAETSHVTEADDETKQ
jgi:hypothetical protein